MPIIVGKQPTAWKDSAARPTHDFSFLRGGGVSGGGAPKEFIAARPKNTTEKEDEEIKKLQEKAQEGEDLSEMTAEEVLDSDTELGVGTWTAPVLDVDSVIPSLIEGGQLTLNSIKAEYINAETLSAISADLGNITAGTITGATIQTATTGTRFVMTSTGFQGINGAGDVIFEIVLTGGDSGDVIMGDDATGKFAKWDDSAGEFLVNGDTINAETTFQIGGEDVTGTADDLNTAVDGLAWYVVRHTFPFTQSTFGGFPNSWSPDDQGLLVFKQPGDGGGGGFGGVQKYAEFILDFANDFEVELRVAVPVGHTLAFGVSDFTTGTRLTTDATAEGAWFNISNTVIDAVNSDGASANTTDVTGATTPGNSNSYKIIKTGSSIAYYVNGVLETTHTTFISTSTTCAFVIEGTSGNDSNDTELLSGSILFKSKI